MKVIFCLSSILKPLPILKYKWIIVLFTFNSSLFRFKICELWFIENNIHFGWAKYEWANSCIHWIASRLSVYSKPKSNTIANCAKAICFGYECFGSVRIAYFCRFVCIEREERRLLNELCHIAINIQPFQWIYLFGCILVGSRTLTPFQIYQQLDKSTIPGRISITRCAQKVFMMR